MTTTTGPTLERILVALDSSPRAEAVLAAAARLAALSSATLVMYRAVGIPPDLPADVFTADVQLEDVLIRNAREDLARLAETVSGIEVKKVAELATAWDGICRAARDHAVDLIVIGAHGYGRLDRLLGTTAAKVVNHADRSVLVVRSPL